MVDRGVGFWFSTWYVVSIDTGHIAQSPQSGPRWSPAFKMEPVLFVSSFSNTLYSVQAVTSVQFFGKGREQSSWHKKKFCPCSSLCLESFFPRYSQFACYLYLGHSSRPPPASFLYQHLHQAFFPVICESFSSLLSLTNIILHTHLFYLSGRVDFVLLYSCILSVLNTA